MTALAIVLGAGLSVLCVILLVREVRATGELVTPWTVMLALSGIDVFVAGLIFSMWGMTKLPPWAKTPTPEDLFAAMALHAAMLLFFRIGYQRAARPRPAVSADATPLSLNVGRAYVALVVTGGAYLLHLRSEVARAGSLDNYLTDHFRARWTPEAHQFDSLFDTVVNQLAPDMLPTFIVLTLVFFYHRKTYNHSILWGIVIPLLGWGGTLTTFFRGGQLAFFMALLIVETLRLRASENLAPDVLRRRGRLLAVLLALGVTMFGAYGVVRGYYSTEAWGQHATWEEARESEAEQVFAGHGLIGLYSIVQHYPKEHDYFYGKTMFDMMLLPVPRYVYREKPEWYGIDDITRAMGWPESTQSAVTITGELYANFGPAGLVLAFFYGVFFGRCYRSRGESRFKFAYAYVVTVVLLVSHWMALTGFINQLVGAPLVAGLLVVVLRPKSATAATRTPAALRLRRAT